MLDDAKFLASDIMTRDVAVVHPETTLLAAVKLMASRRITGLPVVDKHGSLVGMMSEADLLRWHEGFSEREARWLDLLAEGYYLAPDFLREIQEQRRKIKGLMSSKPTITVTETTPAREIASLMHAHRIKRVPVLRDGKLVGSSPVPTWFGRWRRSSAKWSLRCPALSTRTRRCGWQGRRR